jgi:hypothetical protein
MRAVPGSDRDGGIVTILRFDDAPVFGLSDVRVRGLAAPGRGATETTTLPWGA